MWRPVWVRTIPTQLLIECYTTLQGAWSGLRPSLRPPRFGYEAELASTMCAVRIRICGVAHKGGVFYRPPPCGLSKDRQLYAGRHRVPTALTSVGRRAASPRCMVLLLSPRTPSWLLCDIACAFYGSPVQRVCDILQACRAHVFLAETRTSMVASGNRFPHITTHTWTTRPTPRIQGVKCVMCGQHYAHGLITPIWAQSVAMVPIMLGAQPQLQPSPQPPATAAPQTNHYHNHRHKRIVNRAGRSTSGFRRLRGSHHRHHRKRHHGSKRTRHRGRGRTVTANTTPTTCAISGVHHRCVVLGGRHHHWITRNHIHICNINT